MSSRELKLNDSDLEYIKYQKKHRRNALWKKIVSVLSAITVFYTTYILILPAITMTGDDVALCGMVEHHHTEDCYEVKTVIECEESEKLHKHTEDCYDREGNCICGFADYFIHTHTEECYNEKHELICMLPEVEEHTHAETCTKVEKLCVCGKTEKTSGHIHTDACYVTERELTCTETDPSHVHADDCYTESRTLICEKKEDAGHTHTEDCYAERTMVTCAYEQPEYHKHLPGCYDKDGALVCTKYEVTKASYHKHEDACYENGKLICGHIEILLHQHDEKCSEIKEDRVLTCGLPEHDHDISCLPSDPDKNLDKYHCGYAYEHEHSEECYIDGKLVCNLSEHQHTPSCMSDHTADIETEEKWDRSVAQAKLTGVPAEDIVAVAKTQLGYKESDKNYLVDENGDIKGYSRYGAWYGEPYSDWSVMFCSFCISYAGLKNVPLGSSCRSWISKLETAGMYKAAGKYSPKAGDILFWQTTDEDDNVFRLAGVITEVTEATKTNEAKLTVIEGDCDGKVCRNTYTVDELDIIGYGVMNTNAGHRTGDISDVTVKFSYDDGLIVMTADTGDIETSHYAWQWQYSVDGNEPWCDIINETQLICAVDDNDINRSRYYRITGKKITEQEEEPDDADASASVNQPIRIGGLNGLLSIGGAIFNKATVNTPDIKANNEPDVIVSLAYSPLLASNQSVWKKVMTASELTAGDKYLIVNRSSNKMLGFNGSDATSRDSDLSAASGYGDGYFISTAGEQYQWTFSAAGTTSKQMNVAYPSYGIYAGSSTSYGVVNSGHETENTLTLSNSTDGRWRISRASEYSSGTYYVVYNDEFTLSTETSNSEHYIYKLVESGSDDPGTDPGTNPGTGTMVTKPVYPPYTPVSGAKTGSTSVGTGDDLVEGTYWSDPSTSQLENDRWFNGRPADDGKVMTDKSVIYGHDDYGAFSSYDPNTFGVALSALGQDYAITEEVDVSVPLDVVFILDTSGSMIDTTYGGKTSANIMLESLNTIMHEVLTQNPDNRVGVACYSGQATKLLDLGRYTAPNNKYFPEGGATARQYVLEPSASIQRTDGTLYRGTFDHEWQGTYTQDGIATGAQIFFDNRDTTVTRTVTKATDEGTFTATYTAQRRPIIILLSDGEPTYCTEDYNNVLNTTKVHGNGNTGYNNNGVIIADSDRNQSYNNNKGILGYYTILSAQYYKSRVAAHYNTDAYFYTIGIGISPDSDDSYEKSVAADDYKCAVLNPTAANIRHLANCTSGYCLDSNITSANNNISGKTSVTCRMLYQLLNDSYSGTTVNISNSTQQYGLKQATTSSTPVIKNPYKASGYAYTDGAYFSTDTSVTELTAAFSNAINFSQTFPVYGFILKKNTPIITSDTIGAGMELKSEPILNYGGQNYAPTSSETNGNVTTYHYSGTWTATDGSGRNADLSMLYAEVITHEDGQQEVRFYVPDSQLPTYSPNLKNDGTAYFYFESLPARLIYQVGLTDEALNDIDNMNGSGETLTYYTNSWDDSDYSYSSFTPTSKNPYYIGNTYDKDPIEKTNNTTETRDDAWKYTESSDAQNVGRYLGNNGKLEFTTDVFQRLPITVYKVDEDGEPIDTGIAEFSLYKDAELTKLAETVETNENGKATFTSLRTGKTYYLVETKAPDGYALRDDVISFSLDYDGNITGLTGNALYYTVGDDGALYVRNDYQPVDFVVEKQWTGELEAGESYPASIEVQLYADGTPIRNSVVLNASNSWRYTWSDLQSVDRVDKHLIVYTVQEVNAPDGYILHTEEGENGEHILINQKIGKTSVSVQKKWDGDERDYVVVELLKNGNGTGNYVTLNEDNDWACIWEDLPDCDQDGPIVYSVREIPMEGYTNEFHRWTGPDDTFGLEEGKVREAVTSYETGEYYILTYVYSSNTYALQVNSSYNGITAPSYSANTTVTDAMLWKAEVQSDGQVVFINKAAADANKTNRYLVLNTSNNVTLGTTSARDYTWRQSASGSGMRLYGTYTYRNTTYNRYFIHVNETNTYGSTSTTQNSGSVFYPLHYTDGYVQDDCEKGDAHYIIMNTPTEEHPDPIWICVGKTVTGRPEMMLEGAEFELYLETGLEDDDIIPGTSNRRGELVHSWTSSSEEIEQIQLTQNGIYYAVEKSAPKGYEPIGVPVIFEIRSINSQRYAYILYHPVQDKGTMFTRVDIPNNIDYTVKMPNTGGMGTKPIYAVGIALLVTGVYIAVFRLISKRRKKYS